MSVPFPRRLGAALLPLAVAGFAACTDSSGAFDAIALSESTDAIIDAMDDSPAMQSMGVLGDSMKVGAPGMEAASLLAATLPDVSLEGSAFAVWAARRLATLQAALPALSTADPRAVIIPDLLETKTFTYDPATHRYVLSNRTGGPDNGVRFILYAVNPITHTVVEPLNEIGYADLIDESTSTTALRLHLKAYVTNNATPLIDYTAGAAVQGTPPNVTGGTVTVTGYVSDGTTQVDFDLLQNLSVLSGIHVEYTLGIAERDVEVNFEATYTITQQATVTLTVVHAGKTTVVAASGTVTSISGTIKHNGDVVMNISGTATAPVFTDPSGNPPTPEQGAALAKLFSFADELLDHVDHMMAPAHNLLGLALFFA